MKKLDYPKSSPGGSRRGVSTGALEDGEERFRLLVESVKDYAIFMLDPTGHIASWNLGARRMKGYETSQILGKHFSIFYPAEEIASGKPARELEIAVRDGRIEDEGWRIRRDGTRFWANVVITALFDRGGELRGFGKVTRDLTERRQAEDDRVRMVKAEEAVRLRDEFLSIASHELRTPLGALQLYVQTVDVAARRIADTMLTTCVDKSLKQVARMGDLIDRLLDVSRIAEGRLTLRVAEEDLAEVVRSSVEAFTEPATRIGTAVTFTTEGDLVTSCDRVRIEQLVMNLLSNAIKYGGGKPIAVRLSRRGDHAVLEIADEGIGIAVEDRDRIFQRFERAASSRHYGGLGLGLYVAQQIVGAHHGEIRVESEVGRGTTFIVTLPLGT